jgi:RNA polymerase primary sigma factor
MTRRPDHTLIRRAARGDRRARDRVVLDQLPMVRSAAARYRRLGLAYDDLVQEGSLGLLEALGRYDSERGDFDAFARAHVRHAIHDALTEQSRLVRLPKQVVERRRAIMRAASEISAAGGQPSAARLADAVGVPVAAVVEAQQAAIVPVPLEQATSVTRPPSGPSAADPAETVVKVDEARRVRAAVAQLPERQRQVVSRHFGVGGPPATLAGVASSLHLSPQRTRAIEQAALAKLLTTLCGQVPTPSQRRS